MPRCKHGLETMTCFLFVGCLKQETFPLYMRASNKQNTQHLYVIKIRTYR